MGFPVHGLSKFFFRDDEVNVSSSRFLALLFLHASVNQSFCLLCEALRQREPKFCPSHSYQHKILLQNRKRRYGLSGPWK
jgi:hypothetical protein